MPEALGEGFPPPKVQKVLRKVVIGRQLQYMIRQAKAKESRIRPLTTRIKKVKK